MKSLPIALNKATSLLLVLTILCAAGLGLAAPARAEGEYTHYATFNIMLYENIVLDKYSVAVYLDGQVVDLLEQGDMLTFGAYLNEGIHELSFMHGNCGGRTRTWKIGYIQDGSTVCCELQTHNDNTEIRKGIVTAPDGTTVDVSHNRDADWMATGINLAGKALLIYAQCAASGN